MATKGKNRPSRRSDGLMAERPLAKSTGSAELYWDSFGLSLGGVAAELLVVSDGEALLEVRLGSQERPGEPPDPTWRHDPGPLKEARSQLEAYASGELTRFDLPLRPLGTPFRRTVWEALLEIPYGQTATYGEVAERLGRRGAARAVGAAAGANPIGIVVPCHRVVGSGGVLTGYAAGLRLKEALLDLEKRVSDTAASRPSRESIEWPLTSASR